MKTFLVANLVINVHIPMIFHSKILNNLDPDKKNACFFFCFKEITYLCSPKM